VARALRGTAILSTSSATSSRGSPRSRTHRRRPRASHGSVREWLSEVRRDPVRMRVRSMALGRDHTERRTPRRARQADAGRVQHGGEKSAERNSLAMSLITFLGGPTPGSEVGGHRRGSSDVYRGRRVARRQVQLPLKSTERPGRSPCTAAAPMPRRAGRRRSSPTGPSLLVRQCTSQVQLDHLS
jgi:hypothetical protein